MEGLLEPTIREIRLGAAEVPIPYARHLEEAALPQVASIIAAAKRMVTNG